MFTAVNRLYCKITVGWPGPAPGRGPLSAGTLTGLKGFTGIQASDLQLRGLLTKDDAELELARSDARVTCVPAYAYVENLLSTTFRE